MSKLTHFDDAGQAHMVDVGDKAETERIAVAAGAVEMQAAEARLHSLNFFLCPHCDTEVERDFLRCPSCMRKLKDPCANCAKPLDPSWRICPYCEAEIPGVTPTPRSRRRRRRSSGADEIELEPEATASFEAPPQ